MLLTKKDILKRILTFIIMTITCAITIFFLLLMLFQPEGFLDVILSPSVRGGLGFMFGIILGFIAGAVGTYKHFAKELEAKEKQLEEKNMENDRLNQQLTDAEGIVRLLLKQLRKKPRKKTDSNRASSIIDEISDLSEEEIPDSQEHPQEDNIDLQETPPDEES